MTFIITMANLQVQKCVNRSKPMINKLEEFILDDDLKNIENNFNQFNIFDCLKLSRAEIRHSNFLGWLLNPSETHGFGDSFLKHFLKSVLIEKKKEISNILNSNPYIFKRECEKETYEEIYKIPNIFEIDCWDMSESQVYRESENNIDILIVDERNRFVLVIENKIDSFQHDEQLKKYREYIDIKFSSKNYSKLYIYLKPKKEIVEKPYIFIDYEIVLAAINKLLAEKKDKTNRDIVTFIEHYIKILGRDIMEKDEISKICKQIYKRHKTAIDLINKYRGSIKEDLFEILKSIIEQDENLSYRPSNIDWIRFIPKEAEYQSLNIAIEDWVESNNLLIFEINNKQNMVNLDIVLRRVDEINSSKRELLLDIAKTKFNFKKPNKKGNYDHIKSVSLITSNEYNDIITKSTDELYDYLKEKMYSTGIIKDFIDIAKEFDKKVK